MLETERRLSLIHRVIVPDKNYPKEYAVLITDKQSIFVQQPKSSSSFVLRGEMRYGTALVTDVQPKTLEDYEQSSLESLTGDPANLTIPLGTVKSLIVHRGTPEFRKRDFFIWLTMRRQGHTFNVYDFTVQYEKSSGAQDSFKFYLVPLGVYFKPRRATQNRADILRDYAMESLRNFEQVLPVDSIVKDSN